MWLILRALITTVLLIGMAATCKVANADMKKVDDLRRYYRDHGLDFFGELIVGAESDDDLYNEKKHAKLELLADDARTRALAQLEMLLKTANGPMEADLLLRKATLLSDRARTATYFQNNPVRTSRLKEPKAYLRDSIAVFQTLERRFGGHPKMDIVLFSIAYDYEEMRDKENAYRYYEKLVSRFAASPLVGDALLAMAEISFDKRNFKLAEEQLKRIIAADHPRLKNFALYKLAWTYYNAKHLSSAMASLERVVDGVNNAGGVQRARLELRKEALHDLVTFYADSPDPKAPSEAPAYFERIARTPDAIAAEYAQARARRLAAAAAKGGQIDDSETDAYQVKEPDELLFRLAQLYRDQGKHLNALEIAGLLIDRLPRHPRTVALYRLRAESFEKARRRDQVVGELERLSQIVLRDLPQVDEYSSGLPLARFEDVATLLAPKASAADARVRAAPPAREPEPTRLDPYQRELAKISFATFHDFATFLHGEWTKTQESITARQALSVYDQGVKVFVDAWRGQPIDPVFELRRQRAQLRLALKQWDAAAGDFNWLASHAESAREAALPATLSTDVEGEVGALEAWLKDAPAAAEGAGPKAGEPSRFTPAEERLFAAYDRYLLLHAFDDAKKPQAAGILISAARLAREHHHDEDALARLMLYSRRFPDQKDAVAATQDILKLLNDAARWQELREFSGGLLRSGAYASTPAAPEIRRSHEYASLRLLEKLEADKDWDKASSHFADFAKEHPDSAFASQALIKSANAALEASKLSKDPVGAIARLEAASLAPDAAVKLQALLGLEPFYRKAFQWDRLRDVYAKALALIKKDGPDARTRAAVQANLEAVGELGGERFAKAGEKLVTADPEVGALVARLKQLDAETKAYRQLRFARSNNNPSSNFKKKTDLQTALAERVDKLASQSPKALRGAAEAWAAMAKSELVIELADSIESAALPAILLKAAESDRAAYRQTIEAQVRELREAAQKLAGEAYKLALQIDSPIPLEERINALLERAGDKNRLARADLRVLWSHRPGLEHPRKAPSPEELVELGNALLRAGGNAEDSRAAEARLIESYARRGENGYAYAVASALVGEKTGDDPARLAASTRFRIDLERLPSGLRRGLEQNTLAESERWDLARWLAGRAGELEKEDKAWVDEALQALLKPKAADAVVIQAQTR